MILRTRDESLFQHFDVLCDIGGTYDPETNRFDHHQKSFNTSWFSHDEDKER